MKIILALKNVCSHNNAVFQGRVGGLHIDACRISYNGEKPSGWFDEVDRKNCGFKLTPGSSSKITSKAGVGRYPSNLIHDGSDREQFPMSGDGRTARYFYEIKDE